MKSQSYIRVCAYLLLGVLAVVLNGGCADYMQKKSQPGGGKPGGVVPVPDGPRTIQVEIDVDTLNYRIISPPGARTCSLCTRQLEERYGRNCERAGPNANICQGLVTATVQDANQLLLLRSRKNPDCIAIGGGIFGGTDVAAFTQLCFCSATDAPGSCPAPAWYQ